MNNPHPDHLKLAITAILLAAALWTFGDALIKRFNAALPLWQMFLLRSAMVLPALLTIFAWRSRSHSRAFPTARIAGWIALRSLLLVCTWVAYYAALPHVPLAVAAAVAYTTPIFIVLFAALFLGEAVGARGWAAVLLGFAGVLFILNPRAADFNFTALLPLISAVCYAAGMVITRAHCRAQSPLLLAAALHAGLIATGAGGIALLSAAQIDSAGAFFFTAWSPLGAAEWRVLIALAAAACIASIAVTFAYQRAPASVIAAFDFAYLPFAAFWGLLFFLEIPGAGALAGMLLITAGGMLALRRRAQRHHPRRGNQQNSHCAEKVRSVGE